MIGGFPTQMASIGSMILYWSYSMVHMNTAAGDHRKSGKGGVFDKELLLKSSL